MSVFRAKCVLSVRSFLTVCTETTVRDGRWGCGGGDGVGVGTLHRPCLRLKKHLKHISSCNVLGCEQVKAEETLLALAVMGT